jgi:cytochrome c-type biogenesis protein CcmH/NrfG
MAKKINPNHIKTVVREAQAYLGLSNYLEAAVSFWEALKQEPHNQEIFAEFNKCKQLAQEQHQNNS